MPCIFVCVSWSPGNTVSLFIRTGVFISFLVTAFILSMFIMLPNNMKRGVIIIQTIKKSDIEFACLFVAY